MTIKEALRMAKEAGAAPIGDKHVAFETIRSGIRIYPIDRLQLASVENGWWIHDFSVSQDTFVAVMGILLTSGATPEITGAD